MMKRSFTRPAAGAALVAALGMLSLPAFAQDRPDRKAGDLPPWDEVSKDFEKVTTTTDGSFYNVYLDKKRDQLLAELPRGWENQKHMVAITQASGGVFAGLQGPERFVYWKKFDKRLALMEPEPEPAGAP